MSSERYTATGVEYVDPKEAAVRLGVNTETVKRGLRKGIIPGRKVGKVWRIPKKWLEMKQ